MKCKVNSRHRDMRVPQQQTGVVLVIALIVLVAMTLAGIGLMRAVDTSTRVAGNLGYRQANVQAADVAIRQATNWIMLNSPTNTVNNDTLGYFATTGTAFPLDAALNVLPYDQFDWDGSALTIPENPTTKIAMHYIIERDCEELGSAENTANNCSLTPRPPSAIGGSKSGGVAPNQRQVVQYRITARVTGPRNTVTYVQGTIF